MPEYHQFWDPNEWESHVYRLLQDRHGPLNVCKVPARHKGDFGLDYYSAADQVVYQCYAVQEPCEVADRADKQQAKITTDLKKFCTGKPELLAILGTVQIKRWVLVVPLHDSAKLNGHCTKKTAEVKASIMSYVSSDFEVMIQDLDSFDLNSRTFRALQRQSIKIPNKPATSKEIEAWTNSSNDLVKNLTDKLRKRVNSSDKKKLEEAVETAIGWFLNRENTLDDLRVNAPELHETLMEIIARHTECLTLYGPTADGSPSQILRTELESLKADIEKSIPNFSSQSVHQMAIGTIADWLIRCPLDFPPYNNHV